MTKSPDAFRTISEVADLLETPAHVLRFWESRFPQIRPVKRAGGRRYYRPADVALLTGIRHLLHDEGMTIRGVQKILREQGVRHVSGMSDDTGDEADDAALEAALAASVGPQDGTSPLPPAEAETAQIIALQTALWPAEPQPPEAASGEILPPEITPQEEDLFARLDRVPAVPDTLAPTAEASEDILVPQLVGGGSSDDPSAEIAPEQQPKPDADAAPMAVWAEAAPADTPPAATPSLKITRISAPSHAMPDAIPPTIAQRLRATKAAGLSASDRATLIVLRAKARSLRDRLGNPPRFGV